MENYQQINGTGVPPQNFMTLAIIATILGCCTCSMVGLSFILGLIAIYFASQVNSKFYAGDVHGAEKNAKYAKILSLIALAIIVLNLAYQAYVFLAQPEMFNEQYQHAQDILEQYGIETE